MVGLANNEFEMMTEIRDEHLPNGNLEPYRYTKLLGNSPLHTVRGRIEVSPLEIEANLIETRGNSDPRCQTCVFHGVTRLGCLMTCQELTSGHVRTKRQSRVTF
jgi:hypothetical protein